MKFRLTGIWIIMCLALLSGCALLPVSKKMCIQRTPQTHTCIKLCDYDLKAGFPEKKILWVAYSDRNNNATTISCENEMPLKKLGFMEPVFILKEKKRFVKIAAYNTETDLAAKSNRFDKKTIKVWGWIKKDRLLLWSVAMKDRTTNYFAKGISCIANGNIVNNTSRFLSGDSLALFNAPDLLAKNGRQIAPGTIVYLYKQSQDGKSILVGNNEYATPENMKQNILGWMSIDAVRIWGTRAAFTFATDSIDSTRAGLLAHTNDSVLLDPATSGYRSAFENIFPVRGRIYKGDSVINTAFLENILDYSKNKVQNVLGNPIYYSRYKDIIKEDQRANIIFVLDMSSAGRNNQPAVAAFMQEMQLYFDTANLFRSYHFGAVTYKGTHCRTDNMPDQYALTSDFSDVVNFIAQKAALTNCEDGAISQPVYKSLSDACSLLEKVKNESNIIVLIGGAGNDFSRDDYSLSDVLGKIAAVRARLLLFQQYSKSSDVYNDFVLSAEKLVTNAASELAEVTKARIVDMKDVVADPGYNLVAGDSGVYFLDYPRHSMSQGIVLFPKKNEIMPISLLERYFDTMMHQVAFESRHINTSLRNYFKNVGIKYATVKPGYAALIDSMPQELPLNFAKAFSDEQYSFFIPVYKKGTPFTTKKQSLRYGMLLSENEYDRQVAQLYKIYQLTGGVEHFKKRRAYRKYKRYAKQATAQDGLHVKRKLKHMQVSEVSYLVSGYVSSDSTNNTLQLRQLKKLSDRKALIRYYNRYKQTANALLENKNTAKVRVISGEQSYFWIDEKWMP